MSVNQKDYYVPPRAWTGRIDGPEEIDWRWHQWVTPVDLTKTSMGELALEGQPVLIGFACDEGVKRNLGRVGAVHGPRAIRAAASNLPKIATATPTEVFDFGDIVFHDNQSERDSLEQTQQALALLIEQVLDHKGLPVILGGGHEVTFATYLGARNYLLKGNSKLGIINLDAHFDNREPSTNGINSGTGFWQIERECEIKERPFQYAVFGIQEVANTQRLFKRANNSATKYVLARDFIPGNELEINLILDEFLENCDHIYLTIDLDVFAAAYAPGVSATTILGIPPDSFFLTFLSKIFASRKVIAVDIAELNPTYDIDHRTAKLAATLLHEIISLNGASVV